jgi:hypothetical protein
MISYFIKCGFILSLLMTTISSMALSELKLVEQSKSNFKIIIPSEASETEVEASKILQQYIERVSKAKLQILRDSSPKTKFEILLGKTNRFKISKSTNQPADFYLLSNSNQIIIDGEGNKGLLYGVYYFIENYLGCKMYTDQFSVIPSKANVNIPINLKIQPKADFDYREVYYPYAKNQTYLDWQKLQKLDDHWGLWVHTFDKLVSAKQYFKTHPNYFALVDGKRKDSQLCLSNPDVFKILTKNLREKILNEPTMKFWSVSQNDDLGYCECDLCKAVDEREGGPQGSILKFVNKVAAQFPDKIISTLAYTYSQKAPKTIKPAKNVQIMLCSIDCNRSLPIAADPRSVGFRRDLENWSQITSNLFVWDYNVQFTNYVSPFPNLRVLQANLQFFKSNGVKGVFLQGSGDTPAEFSALRAYMLAKLSWNVNENLEQLNQTFLKDYYGNAAPFIQKYINLLHNSSEKSGRILDIYGSPVTANRTYLAPELIEQYGNLFDQAEQTVRNNATFLSHVKAARLPVEYAVLQQSKFYGIEKHGAFVKKGESWITKPTIKTKVNSFVAMAKEAGITALAEGGFTPDEYAKDWETVIADGPKIHYGLGAKVIPIIPVSEEYPNKGAKTLTDGSRGYLDFQYNWLGWYGDDMEVIIDLGKIIEINSVTTSFLEDQRHWSFPPAKVNYSFSLDGENFAAQHSINSKHDLYEQYEKSVIDYEYNLTMPIKTRYVKVKAQNLKQLPQWRYYKNKKAWLFADEIMIK